MEAQLRHFPMIVTMNLVLFAIISICLIEIPVTMHTSTNLTYSYIQHDGKRVIKNAEVVLIGYGLWLVIYLFVVHIGIDVMYEEVKTSDIECFKDEVSITMRLFGFHCLVLFGFIESFQTYSENMERFWWFNIRMTCCGILSIPFIAWYFDYMDLHAQSENIPTAKAIE